MAEENTEKWEAPEKDSEKEAEWTGAKPEEEPKKTGKIAGIIKKLFGKKE